ncbi:MAG: hypothetical protein HYY18_19450 [Planctomycetes bacterium]|nr:hypothetical protein [Planctomycetota bacterium]
MREFLRSLGRRARVVAAREGFLDGLFWGSFAAASLLLADRIRLEWSGGGRAWSDARGVAVALGAAAVLAVLAALARAFAFRAADRDLAQAADRRLGLADRLATAAEGAGTAFDPLVARAADAAVQGVPPRRVFPAPPLGLRAWSAAAVAAALLILLVPLPEPRAAAAQKRKRDRRPGSGEPREETPPDRRGGTGGDVGVGSGPGEDESPAGGGGGGGSRGRPAPAPPLFGDPERGKFRERPERVDPLLGKGDWKPTGSAVDPAAAAAGAPEAATEAERLTAYRRQAEAFVGRDGFPAGDRAIVKGYFERVAPR